MAFPIDPLLAAPLVAAALFVFGAVVYLLVVRFAVRAKANAGMVQIFSTFGLAIVMRGLAQYFFTPDYRSVTHSWLGGKTVSTSNDVRDAIAAARDEKKNMVLMRVRSGDSSRFVPVPISRG